MSPEPGGSAEAQPEQRPPEPPPNNSADPSNRNESGQSANRRRRGRRSNMGSRNHDTSQTFKGALPGYEKHVCDVTTNKGSDAFNTTTRMLVEYIWRTVPNAGEFLNAMDPEDLRFMPLYQPNDPNTTATIIELEIWKMWYKQWDSLVNKQAEASKAAYAVIIGQCSDSIKVQMKTYPAWSTIQGLLDVIGLLQLIRTSMYKGTATRQPTLSLIEAESEMINCRQHRRMSNMQYLETFCNHAKVYEHLGSEPRTSKARIHTHTQEKNPRRLVQKLVVLIFFVCRVCFFREIYDDIHK